MTTSTAAIGARGGAVALLAQGAKLVIQFIGVIVLSRLLAPEDFGLIAMVAVFVALGDLLRDFGLPTAALQARQLSGAQASNLFWLNGGLGIVVAALMLLAAPAIVVLYSEPRLFDIVPVAALALFLSSLGSQFQVHLARSMRFLANAVTDVVSQVLGLAVAIGAALLGAGYWALAWQSLSIALSLLVLRALAAGWVPEPPRRGVGTRAVVGSGTYFGLASVLRYAATNVDTLLIGARFDSTSVGYYARAFQLLNVPVHALLNPLTAVVVPTVNRLRDEGRSVDTTLLRIQSAVGIPVICLFAVSAGAAERLLPLLLGEGWEPSIALFQILAAGGAVSAFSTVSYWGFILHHKSRQLLYYNLVTKSFAVALVVVASFHSVAAVAIAYSAGLIVSWPVNLVWLARCAGQRSWRYFANGARTLAAGALGFLASMPILLAVEPLPDGAASCVIALASALVFVVALVAMPGGLRELRGAWEIATTLRRRSSA